MTCEASRAAQENALRRILNIVNARHWLLSFSFALALVVGFAFAPASYDDGYITYRYADNLAHGRGFAFNPGDAVFGTSAPGYAATLAALDFLLRPLPVEVDAIGAVLFLASMAALPLLLCSILRRLGADRPELAGAVFALLAIPARWNVEMMGCEQVPMLALVAAAFLLALNRQDLAAGLCAGIAGAFRFDAGLAVVAIASVLLIERRRVPWRFAFAASLPVAACWSWLYSLFGTILPTTLAGKKSEFHLISRSYSAEEVQWLVRTLGPIGATALALLAAWGIVSVARSSPRVQLYAMAMAGWLLLHEAFYRFIDVPFAPWYQIPTFNALLAASAVAVAAARKRLSSSAGRNLWPLAAALCLACPIVISSGIFTWSTWGQPPDPRIRIYRDVALALESSASPGESVASVEVGALGYFGHRPVMDLAGLLNEGVRDARSRGSLVPYLEAHPPDYFLDNPAFHSNFLAPIATSSLLASSYRSVSTFTRPEYPFTLELMERQTPQSP
jgi:hypothetical protein